MQLKRGRASALFRSVSVKSPVATALLNFCAFSGYDTGRFWEDKFELENRSQKARSNSSNNVFMRARCTSVLLA